MGFKRVLEGRRAEVRVSAILNQPIEAATGLVPRQFSTVVADVGDGEVSGRNAGRFRGGESLGVAPSTNAIRTTVVGDPHIVSGAGGEAIYIPRCGADGIFGGIGEISVRTVLDNPLVAVTGLVPAHAGAVGTDVGDGEVCRGRTGRCSRGGEGHHIAPAARAVNTAIALHLELVRGLGIQTAEGKKAAISGDGRPRRGRIVDNEIVYIKIEHIGAVVVAEGHIALLAGVGTQVNGVLIPAAWRHCPFEEGLEVIWVGVASRRNGDAEVL